MRNGMLGSVLGGIAGIVLGCWCYWRGLRAGMRAVEPRPCTPVSPTRIAAQLAELRTRPPMLNQMSLGELPHHGCPSPEQWLVLLQQHPLIAHTIIDQLLMRAYQAGVHAEIVVIASIESYHATLAYLRAHHAETVPIQPGQPVWKTYPTRAEWQQLVETDRVRAQQLASLLLLQQARFGLKTPAELQASLDAFDRVMAAASDAGTAPTS